MKERYTMNLFRLLKVLPDEEVITIVQANYEAEEFNVTFSDEAQELDISPADLITLTVKLIKVDNGDLTIYVTR